MENKEKKYTVMHMMVLGKIRSSASKEKPIKQKDLRYDLNISSRKLKAIISDLRDEYPIMSRQSNGGGVWLATSEEEILDFITMINSHKKTYEKTIEKMNRHLVMI